MPVITLNNYIIQIEQYAEQLPANSRARAWLDVKPRLHRIIPGRIYEQCDVDLDDSSTDIVVDDDKIGDEVRQEAPNTAAGAASSASLSVVPQNLKAQDFDEGNTTDKTAKRKLGNPQAQTVVTQGADNTTWLMDQLKEKDALIANLTATVEGMRQQLHCLQETLNRLAVSKDQTGESSSNSENL